MMDAPAGFGISRFQHFDIHSYLPGDILAKVDVASMAHGLEVRVPLLDHVVMELAARVPESLKLHTGKRGSGDPFQTAPGEATGKYLLKRLAERFFPAAFVHRRKQGFSIPVGEWFAGGLRQGIEERLSDPAMPLSEFFNMSYLRELLAEHGSGVDHGWRLWSLLFLTEWFDQRSALVRSIVPNPRPIIVPA
jgi:asparagine synthase (glutamine-hydrolysing)